MSQKLLQKPLGGKTAQIYNFRPQKSENLLTRRQILTICDALLATFIVAPLCVGFWRGIWELVEIHSKFFPPYETLLVSCFALVVFNIFEDYLQQNLSESFLFMKIYTYVFAVSGILSWRCLWMILDDLTGTRQTNMGITVQENSGGMFAFCAVCVFFTVYSKTVVNCLAPPIAIVLDSPKDYFVFPTWFKLKMGEKTSLFILDCLFSVLVIGTLVVFVWKGAWALLDILLFPEDFTFSSWSSLILGYTAVLLAFILQPFMRWLCDRITGALRLLVADLFLIFSLIGTVNVWRGIWNLLNIYFLPDNFELSCWITHWVCLCLLILLGCSNSLLVRGVYIDAEEPGGKCVVFPCYYLRIIFQEQKLKKLHRAELDFKSAEINNHHIGLEMNHHKPPPPPVETALADVV